MSRPALIVGFILVLLAAIFHFLNVATAAVLPLLILGVLALAASFVSGGRL